MEITEEQRKRAEANRLAALAKRKALLESSSQQNQNDPWKLFKCRKLCRELAPATPDLSIPGQPPRLAQVDPNSNTHLPERFRVKLEICSPDSFSVTQLAVQGFAYPGERECLQRLSDCLSNVSGFMSKRTECEKKNEN